MRPACAVELYLTVEMNFLMLYMASLGAGESLMGIALVVSTLGELPVWALAPYLLRRLGPRGLLAVALLSGAVRGWHSRWSLCRG